MPKQLILLANYFRIECMQRGFYFSEIIIQTYVQNVNQPIKLGFMGFGTFVWWTEWREKVNLLFHNICALAAQINTIMSFVVYITVYITFDAWWSRVICDQTKIYVWFLAIEVYSFQPFRRASTVNIPLASCSILTKDVSIKDFSRVTEAVLIHWS